MKFSLFKISFLLLLPSLLFWSCEPIATRFEDLEDAVLYKAADMTAPPTRPDTLLVMTWNIRFAAARIPWFGDACGDRVLMTEDEVISHLEDLADYLNQVDPDIVLLQEVDVDSKRSAYVDQMQWLLDRTDLNYGAFASVWKVQFIPSDGLGRMNEGSAILSRWQIIDAERIALPRRSDQDALTSYFYLRWNILKVRIGLPNHDNFYVLNTHTTAFAIDDTKKKQIDRFKDELDNVNVGLGALFVAGGDLNEIPPGSDSTNYCDEDRCPEDDPGSCRDGSDFSNETEWLNDLYDSYQPAVPLSDYLLDNSRYFTHNVVNTNTTWNRKLDYLFTNGTWVAGSDSTHQAAFQSDHAPVSARLVVSP